MPEPFIHLLIPAAALIIAGFDRRLVLIFSPLAAIPDIDIFFGLHRAFLHSFTVLGSIALILLIYTFYYKPQWKTHAIIISILLLSHPFLDLFTGYVQLFWPSDLYFYLKIEAPMIDPVTSAIDFSAFSIILLISTPSGLPGPGDPFPIFYNTGLVVFISIGFAVLYWFFKSRKTQNTKESSTISL